MKTKKGAGPSITWILMATAAFVAIIILSLQGYNDIITQNNITPDSNFIQTYQEIAAKNGTLDSNNVDFSTFSFASLVDTAAMALQTIVGFGFSAIKTIFQSIGITKDIISLVQTTYPELEWVFWLVNFVIVVYIASRFIKIVRQDSEEA